MNYTLKYEYIFIIYLGCLGYRVIFVSPANKAFMLPDRLALIGLPQMVIS